MKDRTRILKCAEFCSLMKSCAGKVTLLMTCDLLGLLAWMLEGLLWWSCRQDEFDIWIRDTACQQTFFLYADKIWFGFDTDSFVFVFFFLCNRFSRLRPAAWAAFFFFCKLGLWMCCLNRYFACTYFLQNSCAPFMNSLIKTFYLKTRRYSP